MDMQKINMCIDFDKVKLADMMECAVRELVVDNSDEIMDLVIAKVAKDFERTKRYTKELDRKDYYRVRFADDELPTVDEPVLAYDGENYGVSWWNSINWVTSDHFLSASDIRSWRYIDPQE